MYADKQPLKIDINPTTPRVVSNALDLLSPLSGPITPRDNTSPWLPTSPSNDLIPSDFLLPRHSTFQRSKAQNETRKLLSHVLHQLQKRSRPPSAVDAFGDESFSNLVQSGNSKHEKLGFHTAMSQDDSEDEGEAFTTDATFDLLVQLQAVLAMSAAHGWRIFDDGASPSGHTTQSESKIHSPFRRSRNSFYSRGERSRSSSPSREELQQPELLSLCISTLATVVLDDCRYRPVAPRPLHPPNGLQAIVLNIARFLTCYYSQYPKVISQIGFALIPAFATFHYQMHSRLLSFFEEFIIGTALKHLARLQGIMDTNVLGSDRGEGDSKYSEMERHPIVSIQVDEAQEDIAETFNGWQPWPSNPYHIKGSNAPSQAVSIYQLSSLVSPLLATVLECVGNATEESYLSDVSYHFNRILDLILKTKSDLHADLLQIASCHTSKSRKLAVLLMTKLWPKAVGHTIITKPVNQSEARLLMWEQEHLYPHQFVPWVFQRSQVSHFHGGISNLDCRCCAKPIDGFGLLCPFCMVPVHFDCYDYPEGNAIVQYSLTSDTHVQRVAMYRFSNIVPGRISSTPPKASSLRHQFHVANFFTLCLCFVCRKPLWGTVAQGTRCSQCSIVAHSTCVVGLDRIAPCGATNVDSSHIIITRSTLRQSCVDFYGEMLRKSREDLSSCTHEELSILSAALFLQLQILMNGIALGSITVASGPNPNAYDHGEFELHLVVSWCNDFLASGNTSCSPATTDYLQAGGLKQVEHSLMFDWSYLVFVVAAIKTPITISDGSHNSSTDSELLNVVPHVDGASNDSVEQSTYPHEALPLSHMRNVLGFEFGIYSDDTAFYVLKLLHHLNLFETMDHQDISLNIHDKQVVCVFPLPLGLDVSMDVGHLISAVESCLSDLDLSVNEFGFLLLVRRLWPNPLASDYALKRLARGVLLWILVEDDNLAIILQDYLAKQKELPGVKLPIDALSWPFLQSSRPSPSSSVNNGGDYIAARRLLLARYAVQWLFALHNQDDRMYIEIIYAVCVEIGNVHSLDVALNNKMYGNAEDNHWRRCDDVLRSIIRLSQVPVLFSIFEELFLRWLGLLTDGSIFEKPLSSLSRLFPREADPTHRLSSLIDPTLAVKEGFPIVNDLWRSFLDMASQSQEAAARSMRWLNVFARSGVDIPAHALTKLLSFATTFYCSLDDVAVLVAATMLSLWLRSMGRQELQTFFASLHKHFATQLLDSLKYGREVTTSLAIIRQSLAGCLLLYGCERDGIIALGIINDDEVKELVSRRKLYSRGSRVEDPITVNPSILKALEMYISLEMENVSILVLKFLNQFLTGSPFLEPYEVDNFILRNGKLLAACAWQFYDIQHYEISTIRTGFLLRILVVDAEPFHEILKKHFLSKGAWEKRLMAVTRLFRIILDVTSPAFGIDERQWRSSTIEIYYNFFSAIWTDSKEEIRLAARTFSATLLPAHFDAISACWNESLSMAPIADRIKLVSFLTQLTLDFPNWRVLSWEAIIGILLENGFLQVGTNQENAAAIQKEQPLVDPEMTRLQMYILLLSLRMIVNGISIDGSTLSKIKGQLVQLLGFKNVQITSSPNGHSFNILFEDSPEVPELALPCVDMLLPILDSQHTVDLPPSALTGLYQQDDRPQRMLVGSVFVDVILIMLSTAKDLHSLPILSIKGMLESVYVILYKYDFDSRLWVHMQSSLQKAVMRAIDILSQDVTYELRQLSLSVVQAFIKRWHSLKQFGTVVCAAIESVAKIISSSNHHSHDSLVTQGRQFIEATLLSYYSSGLFITLLKRRLNDDFFTVLKQVIEASPNQTPIGPSRNLKDALFEDSLSRAVGCDQTTFPIVLRQLQLYVEVVYDSDFNAELITLSGQQLTQLVRRMSDWPADSADASPLLFIAASLIERNKMLAKDLIPYVDTVLRVALNRLFVNTGSLIRVMNCTAAQGTDSGTSLGRLNSVMHEILADALRIKARVYPSTLRSMLEALVTTPSLKGLRQPAASGFTDLAENAFYFIQNHSWTEIQTETDFNVSVAAAKFMFHATSHDASVFRRLSESGAEHSSRSTVGVRTWNILALVALMETTANWSLVLISQLSSFSSTYFLALRIYLSSSPVQSEALISTDINHSYIAIKLWLMLTQKATSVPGVEDTALLVWSELWPPFETFINGLDIDPLSALAALRSSSIAELFLFMRTLRSPPSLQAEVQTTLERLRSLAGESSTGLKLSRALKSASELPPEVSMEVILDQTAKEIVATEKLRILEAKREAGRTGLDKKSAPERYRRDVQPSQIV